MQARSSVVSCWMSPGLSGRASAPRRHRLRGFGRELLGKVTGKDDGAVHAVVALPGPTLSLRLGSIGRRAPAADAADPEDPSELLGPVRIVRQSAGQLL